MARKLLTVEPRSLTGKKVAQMRRSGVLPANVYGKGHDSITVQIPADDLEKTIKASAVNEVLDLQVGSAGDLRPVVIHYLQRHPITSEILHANFFQVALGEKMRADVPLVLTGTSEAVKTFNGVVVTGIETLQVEALPLDIVANLEVDMSQLLELEDSIHVRDVPVPATLTVLTDPDVLVVKVASPRVSLEPSGPEGAAELLEAEAGSAGAVAAPSDGAAEEEGSEES